MRNVKAHKIERKHVIGIRNAVATQRGNGAATAFVRTASALFGWAVENGWLKTTPTLRMKRLTGGHLPTWTEADLALALAKPARAPSPAPDPGSLFRPAARRSGTATVVSL
jgi:hypothetical protein